MRRSSIPHPADRCHKQISGRSTAGQAATGCVAAKAADGQERRPHQVRVDVGSVMQMPMPIEGFGSRVPLACIDCCSYQEGTTLPAGHQQSYAAFRKLSAAVSSNVKVTRLRHIWTPRVHLTLRSSQSGAR